MNHKSPQRVHTSTRGVFVTTKEETESRDHITSFVEVIKITKFIKIILNEPKDIIGTNILLRFIIKETELKLSSYYSCDNFYFLQV